MSWRDVIKISREEATELGEKYAPEDMEEFRLEQANKIKEKKRKELEHKKEVYYPAYRKILDLLRGLLKKYPTSLDRRRDPEFNKVFTALKYYLATGLGRQDKKLHELFSGRFGKQSQAIVYNPRHIEGRSLEQIIHLLDEYLGSGPDHWDDE